MERFPAPGQPPVLQEPIHVDVGEQWARDAALGRAASASAQLKPMVVHIDFALAPCRRSAVAAWLRLLK